MSIKEIETKKLYKVYGMQIPYQELDNLINNKINELMPTVSLPGFRKGKAPLNIVKKKYENNVVSEVIEKLVNDKTKELLNEKKLKPLRQPRINIKKYEKEKPVEIEIKIDLEPEIKLYDFKNLNVNKYEINLDKKTLDKNYSEFLNSQKQYKKIENNRQVKLSDKIMINLSTKNEKVPDFIKSQNNLPIITDSDYQILPDLSKKLIDKKVKKGDKISIKFDLKEILKSKENKDTVFNIEILSIEEIVPFNVNEEFLKKIGVKSEKDLKDNLKKNLTTRYEQSLKQIVKKELMDNLDKNHKFDLPEGILEEEFNSIWHRVEHAKKDNKLDEDDKNLSEENLKKRYNKISKRRVKLALLIQYISREEKISVSEKELTDGLVNYSSQYPGQEKQIIEYFKKNPSSIETIRGPILEEKVIESIFSKAKIMKKKLSIEAFNKLQNDTFEMKE